MNRYQVQAQCLNTVSSKLMLINTIVVITCFLAISINLFVNALCCGLNVYVPPKFICGSPWLNLR